MTDRATHDRPLWPSDEDRRWAYDVLGVPVERRAGESACRGFNAD